MTGPRLDDWLLRGCVLASVFLYLEDAVIEPGSPVWAVVAGLLVVLMAERRRRWRVRNPSDPPSPADRLARVMLNFYEPAATLVALLAFAVLFGGTLAVLVAVKALLPLL